MYSDDSWITSSNLELIKSAFKKIKILLFYIEFCKTHRKKLYKGVNKSLPNFTVDSNDVLLHIKRVGGREEKRDVVTASRARELSVDDFIQSIGIDEATPGK